MTTLTEPTTATGKALVKWSCADDAEPIQPDDWFGSILAIEAEARQQVYDLFVSEEDAGHAQWTLAGIHEGIDYLNGAERCEQHDPTRVVLDALAEPQERDLLAYLDGMNIQSKGDLKTWVGQMKNEVAAARADADRLYQALLVVPNHANPRIPDGEPFGYPVGGHKEYTCPACIALDLYEERMRLGMYGEADAEIRRLHEEAIK